MHPTAYDNCVEFNKAYASSMLKINSNYNIVEIGSQDVNGSLRNIWKPHHKYTGIDFVEGKGVDIVLTDPYKLPLEDNSVDIVLSSSCFEHAEMFWLSYLEIMRVLKPHGLFYLNVPSNGHFHRYPVDCWRFYPDSGNALVTWGLRNGIDNILLESYICLQNDKNTWNDFIAVILKDKTHIGKFRKRILDSCTTVLNGIRNDREGFTAYQEAPEDFMKMVNMSNYINRVLNQQK